MNDNSEKHRVGLQNIVFAVGVAGVLIALLGSTTDTFESLWASTRGYELWEMDDILLGIMLAPAAGLVVAIIQIRQLNRRVAALESGGPTARTYPRATTRIPGLETIVKCTLCAKFKYEDETWLSVDDYISQRCDATVVAGVCPSCRQGAPSKPA